MEFSLRVGDMSFVVFCKFEIVIFKIVQVMTENIPFAFLYVLSIRMYYKTQEWSHGSNSHVVYCTCLFLMFH